MARQDSGAGCFQVRPPERDGSYDSYPFFMRCNQLLFIVIKSAGLVTNRSYTSILLFLS